MYIPSVGRYQVGTPGTTYLASITRESHLVCSTPCCWIHNVWLATVEQTNHVSNELFLCSSVEHLPLLYIDVVAVASVKRSGYFVRV